MNMKARFEVFAKENQNKIWFFPGFLAVLAALLPYFLLGQDVWVLFHDQLDGEVLNYIYRAKYLFQGTQIPELMNGISKAGMAPPAPLFVLFYRVFSPFTAYVVCQALVLVAGYIGMYLLCSRLTKQPVIAFLVSCIFIFLPFMPVYGLSILGQPLLILAFWNLYEGKKKILSPGIVIFYGLCSSFALVGFAVLGILMLIEVVWIIAGKIKKTGGFVSGIALLLGTYILLNLDLVKQVLGIGEQFVSHRTQMVNTPVSDRWGYFLEVFFGNSTYTPAYAKGIFVITLIIVAGCILKQLLSAMIGQQKYVAPMLLLGVILILSFTALFTKSAFWMETICSYVKFLGYFQADRVSWLIPVIWYIIVALDLDLLVSCFTKRAILGWISALVVTLIFSVQVYRQSFFYYQIRQVVFPESYHIMTWKNYYAEDVFAQIEEFIKNNTADTGEKEDYRVVSLGLPPAAALYNGFYCLDGYSNNYALSYKEEFREVIASELAKNDALRCYFDDWGNRCYLVSSETGSTPMIEKYAATAYEDLEIDVTKLKEMGGKYIFSAMQINNVEDLGLEFLKYFETDTSYYGIYLYQAVEK